MSPRRDTRDAYCRRRVSYEDRAAKHGSRANCPAGRLSFASLPRRVLIGFEEASTVTTLAIGESKHAMGMLARALIFKQQSSRTTYIKAPARVMLILAHITSYHSRRTYRNFR